MKWLIESLSIMTVLTLFLYTAGCSRSAITVDSEKISRAYFDAALKEKLNMHKGMNLNVDDKALRKTVSDELVAEALLVREAKARGLAATDEQVNMTIEGMRAGRSESDFINSLKKSGLSYEVFRQRVRNKMTISRLMNSLANDESVTDEEMKEYYSESKVPFLKPERAFMRIIQISGETDVKAAVSKLRKGADFDKLADEIAGSGKGTSTNYGWFEPDFVSPDMAVAVKGAKVGTAHGPYKGKDGTFYLFRIKERKAARVLSFDEAKPQIRAVLLNQKRQELAVQIIETGRKTLKIKINI